MSRIVTVIGSPSTVSKTGIIARHIQDRVHAVVGGEAFTVEIASLLPDLAVRTPAEASSALAAALHAIETADLLIAASPVYKGAYTGLFKHLVDLVDYRALTGVPVALLAVGGSDRHALVVEHLLRPLFGSFAAATLPTGVFVNDAALADGLVRDKSVADRLDQLVAEAVDALQVRAARKVTDLGRNAA